MNRCKRCNWPLPTNYYEGGVFGLEGIVESTRYYRCKACGEITEITTVIDVGGI